LKFLSLVIAARHKTGAQDVPSYRRYAGIAITVWKTACGGASIAAMTDGDYIVTTPEKRGQTCSRQTDLSSRTNRLF
jgi:hypothetical protein